MKSAGIPIAYDFDRDGLPELVCSRRHPEGRTIALYWNSGDEEFVHREEFHVGVWPHPVAAGYLDGDGYGDIVVVNQEESRLTILRGLQREGAAEVVRLDAPEVVSWLAVSDLDGDGLSDILMCDSCRGAILVNWANGTNELVGPAVALATCSEIRGGVVGDFDWDGDEDLALVPVKCGVVLNQGDRSFHLGNPAWASRGDEARVFSGDSSGVGHLIVSRGWKLSVMEKTPGSQIRSVAELALPGPVSSSVEVADFNKDGFQDIFVSTTHICAILVGGEAVTAGRDEELVFYNSGDWKEWRASTVSGRTPLQSVIVADVDGDGAADLVGVEGGSSPGIRIRRNQLLD